MLSDRAEFVRGFEALAAGAALVKVGEDDAALLYGDTLDALRDRLVGLGVTAVLATQGASGATLEAGDVVVTRPVSTFPGRIVDTMGARRCRASPRRSRRSCDGTPSTDDAWGGGAAVGDGCRRRDVPLRGRSAAHAVGA